MQLARHNRVQLIWVPGYEGIVVNEMADQLAWTGSEHPSIGPEPACSISIGVAKKAVRDWTNRDHKTLRICNWTYTRALCQKNEGSVEIKQRQTKMGGWTTYRTLSPKRAPFKIGVYWWSHLQKVPRRRWISHTYSEWLWGCSSCKILTPTLVFRGTKWLLWHPHI
jgi:hypothetical protein